LVKNGIDQVKTAFGPYKMRIFKGFEAFGLKIGYLPSILFLQGYT